MENTLLENMLLESTCDRVSDVVESGVRFDNKILTHHRMH